MTDKPIQMRPFVFRKCEDYEIKLRDVISVTHSYTELLQVKVVDNDWNARKDLPTGCKRVPEYLSNNVFKTMPQRVQGMNSGHGHPNSDEVKRLLKYYGDCPCWNLCTRIQNTDWLGVVPVLIVHVSFRDIRASYIQEKMDIREGKREE